MTDRPDTPIPEAPPAAPVPPAGSGPVEPAVAPEPPAASAAAPPEGEPVPVKTPRRALEGYVAALAGKSLGFLTADFVRDAAAAAGQVVPAPERIEACLDRLARDYSHAALLCLAEAVVEETRRKANRAELSINEVEAVLHANLAEKDLRDMIARAAVAELSDGGAAEGGDAPAEGSAEHWKAKAEEHLNLARSVQADFDNYRKRVARDAEQLRKLATLDLIRNLLPVLDALDAALVRSGGGDDDGLGKVRKLLAAQLQKEGLEEIPAVGEPFDPALHEAVAEEAREGIERETVIELCRAGYRIGDRVVRPAMVKVAVPGDGEVGSE